MCDVCGCGLNTVGTALGEKDIPGGVQDVSRDGESGLTLNMTATPQQRERFINE